MHKYQYEVTAMRCPVLLSALLIFLPVLPAASFATTYTYTGPYYPAGEITSSGTPAYTSSMQITGSITTANPLPSNLSGVDIASLIKNYNFSDGLNSYTEANSSIYLFSAATNAQGQITSSSFYIFSPQPPIATGEPINEIEVQPSFTLVVSQDPCKAGGSNGCTTLTYLAPPSVSTVYMQGEGYDPGAFASPSPSSTSLATAPALSRFGFGALAALFALVGIALRHRRVIAARR